MTDRMLALVVETAAGDFVRQIMPASLLPDAPDPGVAAEEATRLAAAYWGLPDFVFRPALRRRGRGSRELGDALIVVGDRADSVQVKARTVWSENDQRERSWLDKKIKEASDQALGTVRALQRSKATRLVNERGREIVINARPRSWVNVVVLDHPGLWGYVPGECVRIAAVAPNRVSRSAARRMAARRARPSSEG